MILRSLILLIFTILLSSCAKPPLQQMSAAEYIVERAYSLQAMEFAPTEYVAAKTALNDAHQAMEDADYGDAEESLEFALTHARRAIALTEEAKVRLAEEEKARQAALEEEKARQAALEEEQRKQAERQRQAKKPEPKPVPEPKPKIIPLANYDVGAGETLWTISAQAQVYNEGLLWPLLYQANRDQIKDPRQIFPGQTLSIRRDMTEEELEEARNTARESDIFPVQ